MNITNKLNITLGKNSRLGYINNLSNNNQLIFFFKENLKSNDNLLGNLNSIIIDEI